MESSHLIKKGADKAPPKKPYTRPTLVTYGKLIELTAGSRTKSVEGTPGKLDQKP